MKVAIYSLNQAVTVMKHLRYKRNKHNTLINKLAASMRTHQPKTSTNRNKI